jgi:ADP-L-glycero-D-manno-heptose 6-epimerase
LRLFKSHKPEYKDGEQRRDFVWIGDAVDVVLHFAEQEYGAPGGLFNCGTGKARTWLDLVNAVFHAIDKEPHIQFMDMPDALRGRYQYFTEATTEKLRKAGYTRAFTSLEDGIREYVGYLTKRAG